MYFANNFSSDAIENCFAVCNNPSHVKAKYHSLTNDHNNGTDMFFKWFMLMDRGNQKAIADWINENYSGVSF
jgi:hypothetical protein